MEKKSKQTESTTMNAAERRSRLAEVRARPCLMRTALELDLGLGNSHMVIYSAWSVVHYCRYGWCNCRIRNVSPNHHSDRENLKLRSWRIMAETNNTSCLLFILYSVAQ